MARKQREIPSARCARCGEEIRARTDADDDVSLRADFERRYSQHVIEKHDMPASGAVPE